MAAEGIPDGVIIGEINRTKSVYTLNSEVITYLKENGISDRVVDYMLSSGVVLRVMLNLGNVFCD